MHTVFEACHPPHTYLHPPNPSELASLEFQILLWLFLDQIGFNELPKKICSLLVTHGLNFFKKDNVMSFPLEFFEVHKT